MAAMSALMVAAAGATMVSAYKQSEAMKMQGEFAKAQSEANAALADADARMAEKRGEKEQAAHAARVKGLIGEQRVSLAAQGIDLGTGSAAALTEQSYRLGAEDQMTIRNNAWREAWGLKMQSQQYTAAGNMALTGGRNAAGNTLLTGFAQAASYGIQAGRSSSGRTSSLRPQEYSSAGASYKDHSTTV